METESTAAEFRDNLAFWLESLSERLSLALQEVVAPFDFSWVDVGILVGVRDAQGDFPLTKLLYPNPQSGGQTRTGQERFQRFKDAGLVSVRHSDDSPVMVDITELGRQFLCQCEDGYAKLQATLSQAVSETFLEDLKAAHKAL